MNETSPPPSDMHMRSRLLAILHRADHNIYLFVNELFAEIGLTFQQAVVTSFIYHNKGCNQRAIEDHIETRSASVTALLATMVSKGLVEKTRNPVDGREVALALTPKGRKTAARVQAVFEKTTQVVTRGMSEDDIDTLKRLLVTMSDNCVAASPSRSARISARMSARLAAQGEA